MAITSAEPVSECSTELARAFMPGLTVTYDTLVDPPVLTALIQ